MSLDPGNVVIGTANADGIYIAPVGTAPPATATEAWGAGWSALGYLSEDGINLSRDVESEQIRAWQSKSPLRTVITGTSLTMGFTMIELTPVSLALWFAQPVPAGTDDEFTLSVDSNATTPEYALGIDTKDGLVVVRYIFGRATLSANGEVPLQAAAAQGLPVTMEALTDTNGDLATIIKGLTGVGS